MSERHTSVGDDPAALKEKARDAIRALRLPARRPERVWGGPGAGNGCALCTHSVSPDGLGFELQFGQDASARPEIHHMHIWCFAAWESERRSLQGEDDGGTIDGGEHQTPCEQEPG